MDYFHRVMKKDVGIGGWKCPCCAPAPKYRHRVRRMARRRDRMKVKAMLEKLLVQQRY